jgi:hypothetical protein
VSPSFSFSCDSHFYFSWSLAKLALADSVNAFFGSWNFCPTKHSIEKKIMIGQTVSFESAV